MTLMIPLIAFFVCIGLTLEHLTPRAYLLMGAIIVLVVLGYYVAFFS